MVDVENYHGGCCIFQSELLETLPKIKGYFWVRGGIPGIKPSSPPIPHPIVPLISPIPSSLILSSCHPTTSSLYPSSLKFFTPSSTHPSSAPPLFHYWTSSLHPGLVFWSVQLGWGPPWPRPRPPQASCSPPPSYSFTHLQQTMAVAPRILTDEEKPEASRRRTGMACRIPMAESEEA